MRSQYKGLEVESVWIVRRIARRCVKASGQDLVPVLEDEGEIVADVLHDPEDTELFRRILADNLPVGTAHPRLRAWIERVDERPRA